MTCSYCKTDTAPGSRFCPRCGAPLEAVPPRQEPPPYGGGGAAQAIAWTQWVDQTEGAFGVRVPKGWKAHGGVQRGAMHNLPECFFQVVDATGRVGFVLKPETLQFSEPMGAGMLGSLLGMFGGGAPMMGLGPQVPPLPFQDAVSFARGFLLNHWRGRWPDITLVNARLNPVAQARQLRELQQSCQQRAGLEMMRPECTSADVTVDYSVAGGQRVRQSAIVHVSRLINPMGPSGPWFAEVVGLWFAPVAEFCVWDPVLQRILESVHVNPQWQAAQLARDNNVVLHGQIDRSRRIQQISQTLSQTSDIVTQGYWSSEQIHQQHVQGRAAAAQQSDWQHAYSNAILGWEDRWDDNGNHYSISAGHERVWVDPSGGYHYGGQLSNADPTWSELRLRGGGHA